VGVHELLDAEVLRVVREARFEPAMKDGEPVAVQMMLPVTFRARR
jgi:outer membrane biosynthesis protein TonB